VTIRHGTATAASIKVEWARNATTSMTERIASPEPRTEAGKALLADGCCTADYDSCVTTEDFPARIRAIEEQAADIQRRTTFYDDNFIGREVIRMSEQAATEARRELRPRVHDLLRGTEDPATWGVPEDYAAGWIAAVHAAEHLIEESDRG
jgi:hypothetical protein